MSSARRSRAAASRREQSRCRLSAIAARVSVHQSPAQPGADVANRIRQSPGQRADDAAGGAKDEAVVEAVERPPGRRQGAALGGDGVRRGRRRTGRLRNHGAAGDMARGADGYRRIVSMADRLTVRQSDESKAGDHCLTRRLRALRGWPFRCVQGTDSTPPGNRCGSCRAPAAACCARRRRRRSPAPPPHGRRAAGP